MRRSLGSQPLLLPLCCSPAGEGECGNMVVTPKLQWGLWSPEQGVQQPGDLAGPAFRHAAQPHGHPVPPAAMGLEVPFAVVSMPEIHNEE